MLIEFQLSKTFITDFNHKPAIPREDSDFVWQECFSFGRINIELRIFIANPCLSMDKSPIFNRWIYSNEIGKIYIQN